MPEFANPFSQNVPPEKLTKEELIRAIRLDVAAELEAASLYEAHAQATDNPVARKILIDVANEEREHVGEFLKLLNILTDNEEDAWIQNGIREVEELVEEVERGNLEPESPEESAEEEGLIEEEKYEAPTIGSLKE